MPLELQIIRASEFIRLGAHGRLDLAASREILRQLAGACQRRGINQALLDLRDVPLPGPVPVLTPEDLAALVNAFCGMGFSDQLRLAVLYSADPHHRARLFAFMTRLRGWNVKAIENFEQALLWLSQDETAEGRTGAGAVAIPVQRPKDRKQTGKQKIQVPATAKAMDLPMRIRPRAEPSKVNAIAAPDRDRPLSSIPMKISMKPSPKAERP